MTMFDHLKSDVPFAGSGSSAVTGVLHIASAFNRSYCPCNYWVKDRIIIAEATKHFKSCGLDIVKFTLYSDRLKWARTQGISSPLQAESLNVLEPSAPMTPNHPQVVYIQLDVFDQLVDNEGKEVPMVLTKGQIRKVPSGEVPP